MKQLITFCCFALLLSSCSRCSDAVQSAGEKAGEAAGKTVKSVTEGVEQAYQIKIEVADSLTRKGLQLGTISLADSVGGNDNVLNVYIIFNNDFSGEALLRVFESNDKEKGRSRVTLKGKKGEAAYYDFVFDPRTNIDRSNRIVME
jgi:hypothetical protein